MNRKRPKWGLALGLIAGLAIGIWLIRFMTNPRNGDFITWGSGDSAERNDLVTVQREPCPGAPFILPSDGFIGLLYSDPRGPYNASRRHQGIDIFTDAEPGVQPVYAAYDGYVSRESGWISTVIQRIPDNPLNPGEQIWLYYTHMADEAGNDFIEPAFGPGAREVFVEQGTLLGYVGNYDGNTPSRIWTHLHFSVVRDDSGAYLNEYFIDNTYDPSPYLGMQVDYDSAESGAVGCQ